MQQSPQMFGMPTQQQPTMLSTEQIQKYLDENKQLIMAIMESQNLGKINECAQYQAQLQKNLMYLAAIADAQPPAPTGPSQASPQLQQQPQQQPQQPQPQPQMPMQSTTQGPPLMQPPQAGFSQQQTVGYGGRLPFMGQPYEQQLHHIQHQQSMGGMMGMRMGGPGPGPSGLHPALQTGHGTAAHFMDARTRQDGSETGSEGK
ncbi:GRF1-interacting factor 3-like [Silene latifolia]|uniref:GRF1-interacting factor 3-like n=1 Tax=Silene latifolia TaxID=37657 RepID=UPI003D7767BA